MDTKEFLKKTALFGGLSDKELADVLATARRRTFEAGTTMVHEGDPGARGFYLVLSGKADVIREGGKVAEIGPGEFFGEMALLLDDTVRTADVVASEQTTCLVMTQWDFRAMLRSHPDMAASMMLELAQRLRDSGRSLS